MQSWITASAGIVIVSVDSTCAATQPSFEPLPLPPGGRFSSAFGLSADGGIVVGGFDADTGKAWRWGAFRWTAATGTTILSAPCTNDEGIAQEVSADGSTAVGLACDSFAARWSGTGPATSLGLLPGGKEANAWDVSADGSVVVGWCWIPAQNATRAFRWTTASGMQEIPPSPSGPAIMARAVSADGLTVVGEGTGNSFRWTASGGTQDLAQPQGYWYSARLVSDDGAVIIGECSGSADVLVRWTAGQGVQVLPAWPFDVVYYAPMAVSADGSVIAGQSYPSPNTPNWAAGWRWTERRGIEYLSDVLAALGSAPAGTRIDSANGISADGRTIAGSFITSSWTEQAWVGVVPTACYADCNHDLALTIADFGCFQTRFVQGHQFGDCNQDRAYTIADFACFQNEFGLGCQ